MTPIPLNKKLGPVVFLGGMNAMPMMYAMELRKKGIEVLYFVDRPVSDTLSRPENHFQDISYPYPDWIVEIYIPIPLSLSIFRRFFAFVLKRKIAKHAKKMPQAFVLNGFFCSLAPFLGEKTKKVFLSSGSDLDSWADIDGANKLAASFRKHSIFKFMPYWASKPIIKMIVKRQYCGAVSCDKTLYFPAGFNEAGDRVTEKIKSHGKEVIPRYDVSFEPLRNAKRDATKNNEKLTIFSGTRFSYKTFPEGVKEYNKGNDIIIQGIADFYQNNKNIEVHFVEKGDDVVAAKDLCRNLGLQSVVIWHPEMKFKGLLSLYEKSDICFDQVGEHWIGAIGFYALWLGKPLIANDALAVKAGLWSQAAPIMSAATAAEVKTQLDKLQCASTRAEIAQKSMAFAEENLGPNWVLDKLFLVQNY